MGHPNALIILDYESCWALGQGPCKWFGPNLENWAMCRPWVLIWILGLWIVGLGIGLGHVE